MRRSWWILLGMLFLVSKGAARAARKEANEAPPPRPSQRCGLSRVTPLASDGGQPLASPWNENQFTSSL